MAETSWGSLRKAPSRVKMSGRDDSFSVMSPDYDERSRLRGVGSAVVDAASMAPGVGALGKVSASLWRALSPAAKVGATTVLPAALTGDPTWLGGPGAQLASYSSDAEAGGIPKWSALQRAFAQAPKQLENASGTQWAQWLQSNAPKFGVRKLEMETSGIVPYLQGKGPEKVTRGALEQYADQALPQIEKKVLGGNAPQRQVYQVWLDGQQISEAATPRRGFARSPEARPESGVYASGDTNPPFE